jgi:hypothetical protein
MKQYALSAALWISMIACAVSAQEPTGVPGGGTVGRIGKKLSLAQILSRAASETGVWFCAELSGKGRMKLQESKDWSSLSGKSVEEFVRALEKEGFECERHGKAMLVRDLAVRQLAGNPLNVRLSEFSFAGSYTELVEKLCAVTRAPGGYLVTNGHPCGTYRVRTHAPGTVRDIRFMTRLRGGG